MSTPVNAPPSPLPPWLRPVSSPVTEELTAAGAISLTTDTTYLNASSADIDQPFICPLADGNYIRQIKRVYVKGSKVSAGSATWTITGTFAGFTSATLDSTGSSLVLEWDGDAWHMIGGNATATP